MHILNDFFLLSWGEDSDSIEDIPSDISRKIHKVYNDSFREFCDSCSILFIINSENFEKIVQIAEFKELFSGVFKDKIVQKCLVLQTQKGVLEFLVELGNLGLNNILKENFETLRKEGIISYYVSRRLIGLFALIKQREFDKKEIKLQTIKSGENFYQNSLNILRASIKNLYVCVESKSFKLRVEQVEDRLQNEKFSIGVTGVINAGKSTLLNALLRDRILGTSVVPETANLTILRYAKDRFARVNFWNQQEFERIEKSAIDIDNIKKFVDDTKRYFGNSLNEYIQKKSRVVDIDIEDLPLFTSAQKSNKKCNLVKSVELYGDLEFLKEGVEIVDTPGLDDPIVQREEITLQYISECDLMMHLMNVNQSATQKDVDFIIDSILYQNISRLLIVITRVDTVSEEELKEVISYTKKSIQERLKEQNRPHKFDSILKKISFIPVSAKIALELRLKEDYDKYDSQDLDKSGIVEIERYLRELLFGEDNQKAYLIIKSSKNELLSIVEQLQAIFAEEESLLNKTSFELKEEYREFQSQKNGHINRIEKIKRSIKEQRNELKSYFKTLHKFLYEKLLSIKEIAKSRVIDDVLYEIKKHKKLPKKERTDYIVETALKDGLIDILREYRYEFEKKMQSSFEAIERVANVEFAQYGNRVFDSQEFFEKNFKTPMLFQNRVVLLKNMYEIIKKYAKKSPQKLYIEIDNILKDDIEDLWRFLARKIEDTDSELLENFISINRLKVSSIEDEIARKGELLERIMEDKKSSSSNKKARLKEIRSKQSVLAVIAKDLEDIHDSF